MTVPMETMRLVALIASLVGLVAWAFLDRRSRTGLALLCEGSTEQPDANDALPFRAAVRIGLVRSQFSRCTISSARITMKVRVPGSAGEYYVERSDVDRAVIVGAALGGRGIRFVHDGVAAASATLWVPGVDEWDARLRQYGWQQGEHR